MLSELTSPSEIDRGGGVRQGRVGKSTVAVNLAMSLACAWHRTGLLDEDIYGPMIWRVPTMMGALEEMMGQVEWGALNILVVEAPGDGIPGRGAAAARHSHGLRCRHPDLSGCSGERGGEGVWRDCHARLGEGVRRDDGT